MADINLTVGEWRDRAACRGANSDIFFPLGKGVSKAKSEAALEICENCPVKDECYEYALSGTLVVGVWGGTTDSMRREERRHE